MFVKNSSYYLNKNQALALSYNVKLLPEMVEKLGDLIQRRMNEVGIKNKSELARLIGKSAAYAGDLINNTAKTKKGFYTPSKETIKALAKALQVDETEILTAMNYLPENSKDKTDGLFAGIERIPEELQPIAKRQIRAIIDSFIDEPEKDEDFDYIDDES